MHTKFMIFVGLLFLCSIFFSHAFAADQKIYLDLRAKSVEESEVYVVAENGPDGSVLVKDLMQELPSKPRLRSDLVPAVPAYKDLSVNSNVLYHDPDSGQDGVVQPEMFFADGEALVSYVDVGMRTISHEKFYASEKDLMREVPSSENFQKGSELCLSDSVQGHDAESRAEVLHIFANGKAELLFGRKIFGLRPIQERLVVDLSHAKACG